MIARTLSVALLTMLLVASPTSAANRHVEHLLLHGGHYRTAHIHDQHDPLARTAIRVANRILGGGTTTLFDVVTIGGVTYGRFGACDKHGAIAVSVQQIHGHRYRVSHLAKGDCSAMPV